MLTSLFTEYERILTLSAFRTHFELKPDFFVGPEISETVMILKAKLVSSTLDGKSHAGVEIHHQKYFLLDTEARSLDNLYVLRHTGCMKPFGPFWFDNLEIKTNPLSHLPAWVQIASIIAGQVSRRRIKIGEFIWSIRQVAQYNHLNPRTVAKAYRVMMEKGIIESIPKKGYRVGKCILGVQKKLLQIQLQNIKVMALQMEIDKTELIKELSGNWPPISTGAD